jgi:hypothetical protein
VFPRFLEFFENSAGPSALEAAVRATGFEVLPNLPVTERYAIHCEMSRNSSGFAREIDIACHRRRGASAYAGQVPVFSNHMHAIVATK